MDAIRGRRVLLEACYCHFGQILVLVYKCSLPICAFEILNTMASVYENRVARKQGACGSNIGVLAE